jgi:hypothetical protein
VIGAGGGGLAHGPFKDDRSQHGNGTNPRLPAITAPSFGENPAGLYDKIFLFFFPTQIYYVLCLIKIQ